MSRVAVARTYADTLLELADRTDDAEVWLGFLDEVVALYRDVPSFRAFLETPRVSLSDKRDVIRAVFGDRYPELFVRFVLVVMEKRRQSLLPEIEMAARELLNERTGRVHAAVTMTVDPGPELKQEIEDALLVRPQHAFGQPTLPEAAGTRVGVGGHGEEVATLDRDLLTNQLQSSPA